MGSVSADFLCKFEIFFLLRIFVHHRLDITSLRDTIPPFTAERYFSAENAHGQIRAHGL